ncbi:hypothetical protein EDD21DRAFT_445862 [Dissophora ornata]|nr:18S rRNA maturation protein [Dissophora ornata]KAI8598826.1 hypothetical protein EDD21DRAFT_445862 [Dissophora ornata]
METPTTVETKKKFERKKAPSKAPRRMLKKKLRDLERLIKNKNTLKDLPEEVVQETEKKMGEVKKELEALGPETTSTPEAVGAKGSKGSSNDKIKKDGKGVKFTEMRRAGRKIVAFKKQHPSYETSEEESKALANLELDLLYIKHFPKQEEYISIYPESPLEDEEQIKAQAEIREKIAKALASGEIKSSSRSDTNDKNADEEPKTAIGKHPASNWSDNEGESEDEGEDESEAEPETKKHKTK